MGSTVETMSRPRLSPLAGDVLLAVTVYAFGLFSAASGQSRASVYVLATIGILPLALRRVYPIQVLAIVTAATALAVVAYQDGWWPFAAIIAFYSVAAHSQRRPAMIGAAAALIVLGLADASSVDWSGANRFAHVAGNLAPLVAAWFLGDSLRNRRAYLRAVEERAAQLEREQAATSRQAAAEEQARIAREVHDVVAHNLSVIVVQATAADTVFERDPAEAQRAVRAIGATARQALDELRRVLGVIRADGQHAAELAPQPGLDRLDGLFEQVRAAGLAVDFELEGRPPELSPAVELSAYRIVQEALTNSLRHGGARHATVSLRFDDDALGLEVLDDGTVAANGNGTGRGLIGMRERAAILGGYVEAGPRDGGGFRVAATIPLRAPE
jgi:signal transduction histidine kinase